MQKYDLAANCTEVSWTPLWHADRCQWHRCDMHSDINYTTVTCTAVSMTPLGHAHRCQCHVCANMTALWLWLPLTGIYAKKAYICKLSYTLSMNFTRKLAIFFSSRFASRIRSHIQNCSYSCIWGLGGVLLMKQQKSEVENLMSGSLLR
jgi:uncharacterized membrane protein